MLGLCELRGAWWLLERGDLGHFVLGQREAPQVEVALHVRRVVGAGHHRNATLQAPLERDLCMGTTR